MLEALVIFSGFPFLFFATVAISPPSADNIDFYEKFPLFSRIAFAAYCLLPLYLFFYLIIEVAPHLPNAFTLDNVFKLLLLLASIFLGFTLTQIAEASHKRAVSKAISSSIGKYIKLSAEVKSAQPTQPTQSFPPSEIIKKPPNESKE